MFRMCYHRDMDLNVFDPNCPTRQLLDRIADKWTLLVVIGLEERPKRFGELRREIVKISQKVLTEVLRSLERDGIISRHVFVTGPLRVEYRLTRLGHSLLKLAQGLRLWAEGNMRRVLAARAAHDQRDPAGENEVQRPSPTHRNQ